MRILLPLLFLGFNLSAQTAGGGVTDIEGNYYPTVIIGTQEWMAKNLRTATYANGNPIPNVTDGTQWSNSGGTGAYAYFDNISQYNNTYGKLYNQYAVASTWSETTQEAVQTKELCPTGWHVPNDAEWTILTDYLGGTNVAGGKMKSTGTAYWASPNTDATNESGFSALPGGGRATNGTFDALGNTGVWWSSTLGWSRTLYDDQGSVYRYNYNPRFGLSVRCVSNTPVLETIELNSEPKQLVKIVDLMGREIEQTPNTVLIYMYSDGTIERKYIVE